MIYHTNSNQKKVSVVMLILNKVDLRQEKILQIEKHFITIKVLVLQKAITI